MAEPNIRASQVRKLGRTGNTSSPSYFLTLPIGLVRQLNWREGQKLVVKKSRGKLVIEDHEEN